MQEICNSACEELDTEESIDVVVVVVVMGGGFFFYLLLFLLLLSSNIVLILAYLHFLFRDGFH